MNSSEEDVAAVENNPGLLHVSITAGEVWMSDEAQELIELHTGRRPPARHLRGILEFLDAESVKLQRPTFSAAAGEMNWVGFCLMQGLRHAISTKTLGREVVGAFPDPVRLNERFHSDPLGAASYSLH